MIKLNILSVESSGPTLRLRLAAVRLDVDKRDLCGEQAETQALKSNLVTAMMDFNLKYKPWLPTSLTSRILCQMCRGEARPCGRPPGRTVGPPCRGPPRSGPAGWPAHTSDG